MYRKIFTALAIVALLLPSALAGVPRTETQEYVSVTGDLILLCDAEGTGVNVGGACFTLDGSETTVETTITDASGLAAGGYVEFTQNGNDLEAFVFCGSDTFTIPPGADTVNVYVDTTLVVFSCPLGTGAPATTGTITATFS